MKRRIGAAMVLAWASLAAGNAGAEVQTRALTVAGAKRSYILYLPDSRTEFKGLPLVVMLHGGGGTAEQMMRFSRFNAIAAREHVVVAYPQGIARGWNDGRIFRRRSESAADDVAFIRAVVGDIGRNVIPLDRGRIYAAGISNGGFMSFRLACEAADLFAAVAPVTATLAADLAPRCRPSAPISVLVINGTADPLVPYEGGHVRGPFGQRGAIWSTDQTVAFWVKHNRCAASPVTRALPDRDRTDSSHAVELAYPNCAGGRVTLMRIEGGGHTWPGGAQYLPALLIGHTNRDFDAGEAIWAFFKTAPAR